MLHAVGADDDPQSTLRRAPDDLEDVAPQERLAARQDRQAFRREGGDFVDDPEAFLGAELAPIGEVLRADQRRAAGVEIAVLAGEVAAVGEVPGDDVGPGERARGRIHRCIGVSGASHAEEVAGGVEDLLVHFEDPSLPGESARCRSAPSGGRTRECSRAALRRRTSSGRGSARRSRPGRRLAVRQASSRRTGTCSPDAPAASSPARLAALAARLGADPHAE